MQHKTTDNKKDIDLLINSIYDLFDIITELNHSISNKNIDDIKLNIEKAEEQVIKTNLRKIKDYRLFELNKIKNKLISIIKNKQ